MLAFGQLVGSLALAYVFWRWVPVSSLFSAAQPMITSLSIMIAAVFVRLNRGLPTLDWKMVSPESRAKIAKALYILSVEYVGVLTVGTILALTLITLQGFGLSAISEIEVEFQKWISCIVGFLVAFLLCRMSYVVWRDLDIVRLQRTVLENMSKKEIEDLDHEKQKKLADEKLKSMKTAPIQSEKPDKVDWS